MTYQSTRQALLCFGSHFWTVELLEKVNNLQKELKKNLQLFGKKRLPKINRLHLMGRMKKTRNIFLLFQHEEN